MIEVNVIPYLTILGLILILGFIGNYIFNRTQIPSIVWLLILGLLTQKMLKTSYYCNHKVRKKGFMLYVSFHAIRKVI